MASSTQLNNYANLEKLLGVTAWSVPVIQAVPSTIVWQRVKLVMHNSSSTESGLPRQSPESRESPVVPLCPHDNWCPVAVTVDCLLGRGRLHGYASPSKMCWWFVNSLGELDLDNPKVPCTCNVEWPAASPYWHIGGPVSSARQGANV